MNYYNQISKSYNKLHKEEQQKKLSIIKSKIKIEKTDFLLDVGCATGISSDFNCKVAGIDPSIELLKLNKNKIKFLGKAENLPFKDSSFDIIISLTAIQNFTDIKKGLKEIKRTGKKKFILSVLKKSQKIKNIKELIEENFKVKEIIEEEKDLIFFI